MRCAVERRCRPAPEAGLRREAAQVDGLAALALQEMGRMEEAWERIVRAYDAVDDGSDDEARRGARREESRTRVHAR